MASPRPRCNRRLSSVYGASDKDPHDAGYAQKERENITDLLTRLQDPYGDMIRTHITDNKDDRPILLQRALIERVSPWLEKWVQQNMQQFGSRDLYMDTGSETTRKMFLFCVVKRRVPSMAEVELRDGAQDYQRSLIRVWTDAAETGIAEGQDAVMRAFWWLGEQLLPGVLRDELRGTRNGSAMRRALVEALVYSAEGDVPEGLLRALEVEKVFGWEEDYAEETRRWMERGGMRAGLEEFLVGEQERVESRGDVESSEMILD